MSKWDFGLSWDGIWGNKEDKGRGSGFFDWKDSKGNKEQGWGMPALDLGMGLANYNLSMNNGLLSVEDYSIKAMK